MFATSVSTRWSRQLSPIYRADILWNFLVMKRPFSQACEENKQPILDVIQDYFGDVNFVLEVGSGTGQHAIFFAENLPHLIWQTSDRATNHGEINLWLDDYQGSNLKRPLNLDVTQPWPIESTPAIFSANTTHIMLWEMDQYLFQGIGATLEQGGYFCLYGPFNFNGNYTSDSNEQFDEYLKSKDPEMGIRNFEDLNELAKENNLTFINRHAMPANNFILVWQANQIAT